MKETHTVPRRRRLELALEADVDIRSIEQELAGLRVSGRSGERAREVLEKAGYKTSNDAARANGRTA